MLQLQKAFSLLGEQSDLHFQLEGYTVLSGSPLSFFRDGDVVIIRNKPQEQQLQPLALVEGSKKRKRVSVIRGELADEDKP